MWLPLRIIFCWLLLAGLFGGLPAMAAEPDQTAPPQTRIGAVKFVGFDNLPMDRVRAVTETHTLSRLRVSKKPDYDPAVVARDVRRLLELYKEHGFFDATVRSQVTRQEASPGSGVEESTQMPLAPQVLKEQRTPLVTVTFIAHEQAPYYIDAIDLTVTPGKGRQHWESDLRAWLPIKTGQRFGLKAYHQAKEGLSRYLADHAHPLAKVQGQARVYKGKGKVTVVFKVAPGPRVMFGETTVTGQSRMPEEFILKAKTFARGQPYSQKMLEDTQRTLLDTGFFSTVTAQPQFKKITNDQAPVTIVVQERQPHSIRMGVGYGTEDLLRVRILQVNRNVLGWADTLTFEGKVSAIYEGLVGRWRLPYLFNLRTNLLLSGGLEQVETEAYINHRLFISPMFEYRFHKHWTVFAGYNAERDKLGELKTAMPNAAYQMQDFYISSIPAGVVFDNRDSILNPTRGTHFSLRVETASGLIGSEVDFIRPVADLSHVWPLKPLVGKKPWHLAGRAKAGVTYPLPGTEQLPMVRRFFPGGPNSVRGYPYQKLGPLDDYGNPLGGELMVEGSMEVRFPIFGDLGGVVFMDAGNAYENLSTKIFSMRFTAGVGLRYHTPVGPLRLDFGYQLNPPSGNPFPRYEAYLSVGQAF